MIATELFDLKLSFGTELILKSDRLLWHKFLLSSLNGEDEFLGSVLFLKLLTMPY